MGRRGAGLFKGVVDRARSRPDRARSPPQRARTSRDRVRRFLIVRAARRRRFDQFPFGVMLRCPVVARSLLWLAAAGMLAGALTGCGRNDRPANPTIAAIEKLHGRVEVDDKLPGRPVVAVNFDAKGGGTFRPGVVTDDALDLVQGFDQLRSLNLSFTDISDAGLGKLKGLTN